MKAFRAVPIVAGWTLLVAACSNDFSPFDRAYTGDDGAFSDSSSSGSDGPEDWSMGGNDGSSPNAEDVAAADRTAQAQDSAGDSSEVAADAPHETQADVAADRTGDASAANDGSADAADAGHCGSVGEPCCGTGSACNSGGCCDPQTDKCLTAGATCLNGDTCSGSLCRPCGSNGGSLGACCLTVPQCTTGSCCDGLSNRCYPPATQCSVANEICLGGACQQCGTTRNACCAGSPKCFGGGCCDTAGCLTNGDLCSNGGTCNSGVCAACGGAGMTCCTTGVACASGGCCDGTKCVANGNLCSTGQVCANATCPPACGSSGQTCCAGKCLNGGCCATGACYAAGAQCQTAARSVGVAQAALDLSLFYAKQRQQFGQAIISFPRVADKIAMMAAEIMLARQLVYFAARQKDSGARCDLEAGMAKMLAARTAWACADNAVQIHGGNGFALESPVSRLLCDARILSSFEGAAEIQADVIAKRLLAASIPKSKIPA